MRDRQTDRQTYINLATYPISGIRLNNSRYHNIKLCFLDKKYKSDITTTVLIILHVPLPIRRLFLGCTGPV